MSMNDLDQYDNLQYEDQMRLKTALFEAQAESSPDGIPGLAIRHICTGSTLLAKISDSLGKRPEELHYPLTPEANRRWCSSLTMNPPSG